MTDHGLSPGTLLACAHQLADRAAAQTMPLFRIPIAVDNKAHPGAVYDPVTAADRAAEEAISAHLTATFPDHGIEGEEFGISRPDARFRWVIDPIDGTRAFITGSPMWGTLIGLKDGDRPLIGVLDQPFTGERFWSDGSASFTRRHDGPAAPLKTRRCPDPNDAVFMTTDPNLFAPGFERERFGALQSQTRMTRFGGDCYAYALLASGFVDVIAECGLKPYDIVAVIPIIESAGGRVTDWKGQSAAGGGRIVASGDPELHEKILAILAD